MQRKACLFYILEHIWTLSKSRLINVNYHCQVFPKIIGKFSFAPLEWATSFIRKILVVFFWSSQRGNISYLRVGSCCHVRYFCNILLMAIHTTLKPLTTLWVAVLFLHTNVSAFIVLYGLYQAAEKVFANLSSSTKESSRTLLTDISVTSVSATQSVSQTASFEHMQTTSKPSTTIGWASHLPYITLSSVTINPT